MAKRQQTLDDVKETVVERLTWQVAHRDDAAVAGAVHAGEELAAVFPLGDVGLLDEFYHFLESTGVLAELATLKLTPVERVFLPVIQFVLLYLLKALLGIESMNALPVLLFSNVAAMTLIGFNAYQVANGLTRRGDDKRKERPKQGPLSPQCLAQNLGKFTTEQMEGLFNRVVCLLGEHARIRKVVIDRGYLNGEDLWQIDQMGIIFVIVAKAGMAVREDAHALAREEKTVERTRTVRHGHGRTAWTEERTTRLVGIDALTTYDAYAAPEQVLHRNRADYPAQPINAVVVRTWENREYPDGGIVYLTNGSITDPFAVFDEYDWRSVIENGIFKEGKHPWHLTHFPQKTEEAVIVHCFFTLLVMALCTAFRLWQARGEPEEEPRAEPPPASRRQTQTVPVAITLLGGEGTERWRRRLRAENRDKVIVFVGEQSGIFHVSAFAVLAGLRIKPEGIPPELGSPADILTRFGLSP